MKALVALVRVSKDEQDTQRQITALKRYEKETGEKFDQWLEDKLSRDLSEQRPDFQKLIALVEAKKVRRVVVEEFERFGTSGDREFNFYAHKFERAGCELHSIKEGDLLAPGFANKVENLLRSEASAKRQRDISYATQGKKIDAAKTGKALGGIPPWGFDKACYDQSGTLQYTLHYLTRGKRIMTTYADGKPVKTEERNGQNEAPRKSKSDYNEWVPSRDAARMEDIREVFRIFTTERISTIGVHKRMNARGRLIYGHRWNERQVEQVLRNPVYKGDWCYFKTSVGRYYEVHGEDRVEVSDDIRNRLRYEKPTRGKKRRIQRTKNREQWTVKEDHFTALVDDVTFNEAQSRLDTRTKRKHPPRKGGTWLTDLLVCGGCGEGMYAFCIKAGVYGYHCSTYTNQYRETGDSKACTCGHNVIRHDRAEKLVTDKLRELGVALDTKHDPNQALAAAYLTMKTGLDLKGTPQQNHERTEDTRKRIQTAANFTPKKPTGKQPAFCSGTRVELDRWGQLGDFLNHQYPGKTPAQILKLLQIDPTEAVEARQVETGDKLAEVETEFKRWVAAKVRADSDEERQVIGDKVKELKAEMDRLKEAVKPAPTLLEVFATFTDAVRSLRTIKDGDKLRLADAVGKVFSAVTLHFKTVPWGNNGRFKYELIPEKTGFTLSSEIERILPGT